MLAQLLITSAQAQEAATSQAAGGEGLIGFVPIALMFVVFYFLMIRPQQKRFKQHRDLISALKRGDRVVTNGGVIGVITKVDDAKQAVHVEVASGVIIQVQRHSIASLYDDSTILKADNNSKAQKLKKTADADIANDN